MEKKGISAIVATVLTVLITVVGVTIIWVAIVPMIQQADFGSYDIDLVIETRGGYTYFDSEKGVACVQVKRGVGDANLSRIDVLFVYEGGTLEEKGNFSGDEIPGINEMVQKCFNLKMVGLNKDISSPPYIAPDAINVVPIYLNGIKEIEGDIISTSTSGGSGLDSGSHPSGDADLVGECNAGDELYNGDCYSTAIVDGEISNCWQLQNINEDLEEDYILIKDIDCSMTSGWNGGKGFDPIGDSSVKFTGNFDGKGYVISDLDISRRYEDYIGLFGYTSGGSIENVGLVGGSVDGGASVGGLVGRFSGTITNSSATGSVNSRNNFAGGLIGYSSGTIMNSYATGNVLSGGTQIGGLIGYSSGTIMNSYATGNVLGKSNFAGGLVGVSMSRITNSYATGNVGDESHLQNIAGGLVGSSSSIIENSYATGDITGSVSLGGLVGGNGDGTIINSYWNKPAGSSLDCYSGGNTNCVAIEDDVSYFYDISEPPMDSWDFPNDWVGVSGNYPKLAWE